MSARVFRRACALALAALLAACSIEPQRPVPPSPESPAPPAPIAPPPVSGPAGSVPAAIAPAAASPWPRIRARLAMPGCDYRPQVARWARRYASPPRRFEASLERSMPFLLLVVDEIEKRDLAGEFAMLPYVESSYEPIATRGDRPAGMWQLVPDTAREEGLTIDAAYDGRLDAHASTRAALALIARYQKQFGDWRLADMAFNSGEFRVKKLLKGRDAHELSAAELAKLSFHQITHDHLDRLLALSCIVADPARFGVELPEPTAVDHLETVTLEAGMDIRLAARLAGLDPADMKRFNAGYRRNRMPPSRPYELTMPADRIERFRSASQTIPVALWSDWRQQRAARTSGIGAWAAEVGIPVTVLALANAVDESTTVNATTELLLPGRDTEPEPDADATAKRARVHVVKPGDTLSSIAQRYDLSLAELKRLNPAIGGKLLHPGDRLRVGAAD